MTAQQVHYARTAGAMVSAALSAGGEATILGVTSRGVFVYVARRTVLFLSFERYRSPLSITLGKEICQLRELPIGSHVGVSRNLLVLPAVRTTIRVPDNVVWQPGLAPGTAEPSENRLRSLKRVAERAQASKADRGLCGLLPALLMSSEGTQPDAWQFSLLRRRILQLRQALTEANVQQAIDSMHNLLGYGRGLTPSGDDLIVGLLLALNRWRVALGVRGDLGRLNRVVLEAAGRQTTALSAGLIECAVHGESDERLMDVIDCLVAGTPDESECVPALLDWGASSGVDALVGMAVALTC